MKKLQDIHERLNAMPLIEQDFWGPSNQDMRDALRATTRASRQRAIDEARCDDNPDVLKVVVHMMATAEVAALLERMGVVSPRSPRV